MSLPQIEVEIDSVGGLGDGIGKHAGKPVFVPKSCAGDKLSVQVTNETKDFSRGIIKQIITGGPDRVSAACGHFEFCGGCSLQQLSGNAYKSFKRKVLADALSHAGFGGLEADVTFLPPATRRRVDFRVAHKPDGPHLAYHGLRSHSLTAVETCPILHPLLQGLMDPIERVLAPLSFVKQISHVSLTLADSGVDMHIGMLKNMGDITQAMVETAHKLGLARVSGSVGDGKPKIFHEPEPVVMHLGGYEVALPPESFLQAAIESQELLTNFVLEHSKGAKKVADLFCGIGTYSFPLSAKASVYAADSQGDAVRTLRAAINAHRLTGKMNAEARDLFQKPLAASELNDFDVVVMNPPRAGAKAQSETLAASRVKKVVMISCSPASFARDAKILKAAGFHITHALGIDQFVWSPHLEIAAVFER
ncbi:MAG: class I SAM-dependent RNA methyltransferase [Alphaproteobacteria bacterium]|nr:class I SAM-dependent RNA methyltransferase [Alphaproteobacteria bacterium]